MSDVPQLIRGLSEQMESTLKQAGRVLEAKEREEKAQRSALELRIDGLAKFRDLATKEKESVIEAYRTATGASGRPPSQEAEAKFWAKIGELDTAIQKSTDELDNAKQELYFPKSQGYQYSFGTNGVYVGMQDFWIDLITGRLSLQIKHAQKTTLFVRGQSQLCPIHPAVTISLTDFKLKLRLDGLYLKGERGTKVPDAKIQLLDVVIDMVLEVKMDWNPMANAWQPAEGFRFEVLHLDRKQTGSIKVPKKLLRWIINWVAPGAVKNKLAKAIPAELGKMLMATRQSVSLEADFRLTSVPLSELDAVFEFAEDGIIPSVTMERRGFKANIPSPVELLKRAAANLQARAQAGDTPHEGVNMPQSAGRAANWLGLSALQVRTLAAAQKATGCREPWFRSAFEFMRLIHRYSNCGAPWEQFVLLFQKLLDEHQNLGLLRASFEASSCPDYDQRALILNSARQRLQISSVEFAQAVQAAKKLAKKPVRIDFEIKLLQVDIVLQAVVKCVVRTMQQLLADQQFLTTHGMVARPQTLPPMPTSVPTVIPVGVSVPIPGIPLPMQVTAPSESGTQVTEVSHLVPIPSNAPISEKDGNVTVTTPGGHTGQPLPIAPPPKKKGVEVSLPARIKELGEMEKSVVTACNDIQNTFSAIHTEMVGIVSGGERGKLKLDLSEVSVTCPPGFSFPVPLLNSVIPPVAYWMTMQTDVEGGLNIEVLLPRPEGSTPRPRGHSMGGGDSTPTRRSSTANEHLVVNLSPEPMQRHSITSPSDSPPHILTSTHVGLPSTVTQQGGGPGDSGLIRKGSDHHAETSTPWHPAPLNVASILEQPISYLGPPLPPDMDVLLKAVLSKVQTGVRLDVQSLVEFAKANPHVAGIDALHVNTKAMKNGSMLNINIPKCGYWWADIGKIELKGEISVLIRQATGVLRALAQSVHTNTGRSRPGSPNSISHENSNSGVSNEHKPDEQSSFDHHSTIVSAMKKYFLDDHLKLEGKLALSIVRTSMSTLCTPFVQIPKTNLSSVIRLTVSNLAPTPVNRSHDVVMGPIRPGSITENETKHDTLARRLSAGSVESIGIASTSETFEAVSVFESVTGFATQTPSKENGVTHDPSTQTPATLERTSSQDSTTLKSLTKTPPVPPRRLTGTTPAHTPVHTPSSHTPVLAVTTTATATTTLATNTTSTVTATIAVTTTTTVTVTTPTTTTSPLSTTTASSSNSSTTTIPSATPTTNTIVSMSLEDFFKHGTSHSTSTAVTTTTPTSTVTTTTTPVTMSSTTTVVTAGPTTTLPSTTTTTLPSTTTTTATTPAVTNTVTVNAPFTPTPTVLSTATTATTTPHTNITTPSPGQQQQQQQQHSHSSSGGVTTAGKTVATVPVRPHVSPVIFAIQFSLLELAEDMESASHAWSVLGSNVTGTGNGVSNGGDGSSGDSVAK